MADTKISNMTAASTLTGAELAAGVQSGANVKITTAQIQTLAWTAPVITGITNLGGGFIQFVRVALTTPVAVATTDNIVICKLTSPGAVAVSLPGSPTQGTTFVVKDGTGDAGTNNITITPTGKNIDGASTYVIGTNYQSATVVYNGTQWSVI